jgi:hypothetical protein
MHTRRLITLLLGLWLGASLLMDWTSFAGPASLGESFTSVRQREPMMVRSIGEEPVRQLLRYEAAELNRTYAYGWGWAQCIFSVVFVVIVLFATNGNKAALALSAAMMLITLGMQFGVMPGLLELDRGLDFAIGADGVTARAAFAGPHNTYVAMEVLKLLVGFGLAGYLLYRGAGESSGRRRRRSSSSGELDDVNYANHGRINR